MSARFNLDLGQLRTGAPIPFVRASAFAPLVGFLGAIGSPVERWLRRAGIPLSLLDDPEALVPVMSGYRFIESAARQEQIDGLGVLIGQRTSSFVISAMAGRSRARSIRVRSLAAFALKGSVTMTASLAFG